MREHTVKNVAHENPASTKQKVGWQRVKQIFFKMLNSPPGNETVERVDLMRIAVPP
jgi:hypothetical protein